MTNETTRNLSVALRPKSFSEIIGSTLVLNQIRTQLRSGHVPTAILLSGPTGCGKTTLARCITAELNGEPIEANAADDTGVDAARCLGEQAYHRPLMGDYKVIILDEAHQLTKQAQNALLKHVEDAPTSTLWIFCTTEPSKIIPTLRGRCVSFTLAGLSDAETCVLVERGLAYLERKIDSKEFVATLVRENTRSPRAILMATERFAAGMDPLGAIFGNQDSPTAFEVARATYRQDWNTVRSLLSNATSEEAMTIRMVCVNYCKAAMLKNMHTYFNSRVIFELTATIPFDGPLGFAELSARLYNICEQFDKRSA